MPQAWMVNIFVLVIPQMWAMDNYAYLFLLESETAFTYRVKQGIAGLMMEITLGGIVVHTFSK